jgi:hypothetical protein
MMDDDSTRLTERERRVLAEMEDALRRTAPELERSLRSRRRHDAERRRTRRWTARRRMWWVAVALGLGLLAAGLVLGAVPVGAAGFVATLVGIHALTAGADASSVAGWARRRVGLREPKTGDPDE